VPVETRAVVETEDRTTQTAFNLVFSFRAEGSEQSSQTEPTWERIEPRNTAITAVQLVLGDPAAGRGLLRRELARVFRVVGPLNPRERYVVDTVMESVLAMERGFAEHLQRNLLLFAANPDFAIQLAAGEFTRRLSRPD